MRNVTAVPPAAATKRRMSYEESAKRTDSRLQEIAATARCEGAVAETAAPDPTRTAPSKAMRPFPHHRAFTLIELLVTIGIIVLLASLLLPMAKTWNAGAQTVACSNNLRQMFLNLDAYARENNGVYPAVSDSTTGNSWWLTLQNYINTPSQVVGIRKKTIFLCPASLRTYPNQTARRTYGMNCEGLKNDQGVLDWRVPTRPISQSKLSRTLFIADTCNGPANNGDGIQYFRAAPRRFLPMSSRPGTRDEPMHSSSMATSSPSIQRLLSPSTW